MGREVRPAVGLRPEEEIDVGAVDESAGVVTDEGPAVKKEAAPHPPWVAGRLAFGKRQRAGGIAAVGWAGVERDMNRYRALRVLGYVRL